MICKLASTAACAGGGLGGGIGGGGEQSIISEISHASGGGDGGDGGGGGSAEEATAARGRMNHERLRGAGCRNEAGDGDSVCLGVRASYHSAAFRQRSGDTETP